MSAIKITDVYKNHVTAEIDIEPWLNATLIAQDDVQAKFQTFCETKDVSTFDYTLTADFFESMGLVKLSGDNSYNCENDLSGTIDYEFFGPEGADYIYDDDCFVALRRHHGGDVRGNYGSVEIYKLNETGFFERKVGWSCEQQPESFDSLSMGYSNNPSYEFSKIIREVISHDDEKITVKTTDGQELTFFPVFYYV